MLDKPLMLSVKLPVFDIIHPYSNKFFMGMRINAMSESKLNDSPASHDASP